MAGEQGLRLVQGEAKGVGPRALDADRLQSDYVEDYVASWVARGFSSTTIEQGTTRLERVLAAFSKPVTENGFGKTLDFIFVFHANLGIEPKRGSRQRREDQEFARWCFADPQHAASFQALFGGEAIRAIQRMN